jgi:hypothetical protein
MAIACSRLVTFLPDRPERNVPCLSSCIARSTFWDAVFPYFRSPRFFVITPSVLHPTFVAGPPPPMSAGQA